MLRDIEAGRVNMVITKDLSRLGRDYIMTGHYMERYFPEHRVRYISLLDGIDTGVDSSASRKIRRTTGAAPSSTTILFFSAGCI